MDIKNLGWEKGPRFGLSPLNEAPSDPSAKVGISLFLFGILSSNSPEAGGGTIPYCPLSISLFLWSYLFRLLFVNATEAILSWNGNFFWETFDRFLCKLLLFFFNQNRYLPTWFCLNLSSLALPISYFWWVLRLCIFLSSLGPLFHLIWVSWSGRRRRGGYEEPLSSYSIEGLCYEWEGSGGMGRWRKTPRPWVLCVVVVLLAIHGSIGKRIHCKGVKNVYVLNALDAILFMKTSKTWQDFSPSFFLLISSFLIWRREATDVL